MQVKFKFYKNILWIFVLSIIIYIVFGIIPQLTIKSNAATYTYTKSSNNLPSNFNTTYPGYKTLLQTLAKAHPKWTFKLYETGLDWDVVINNEYAGHGSSPKNLSPSTYPVGWICYDCRNTKRDNGTWRCASRESIEYMMDPRNSINESDVFQFQNLSSSDGDKDAIESMVSGTFIDNKECIDAIFEAAKTHKVSPYHLTSRILQEQGKNGSTLGLGIAADIEYKIDSTGKYIIVAPSEGIATGSSTSQDGKKYTAVMLGDVNGDGKVKATDYMKIKNYIMGKTEITVEGTSNKIKYYNLFNIGATGNSTSAIIKNGLEKAKEEGWTSMAASIKGGAEFLANDYISKGQSTLYYQKFNVVNESNLYGHQYMQNILAAQNEGEKIREEYEEYGILDASYTFLIPLYKNMPSTACPKPSTSKYTIVTGELAYINANGGLTLRDEPDGDSIATVKKGAEVTITERATKKVGGYYWDRVYTSQGTGYMAREASDGSKTYLVLVK